MALNPLSRVRRGQRAEPAPFVAPVGGLNRRDALANMPEQDAFVMDNVFPKPDGVETRRGFAVHRAGLGGAVEALAAYTGLSGDKLIGFADGNVWDVTSSVTGPTSLASGRTNNRVQTAMFTNAGNNFLIGVNGADTPFSYNGAAYAALTITGVTGGQNNLANVFPFKGRLYFAATAQPGFYYLPVGNIQGVASYFDLGQIAAEGGYLVAICSITRDSGNGPDDYIVFVMSTGEFIVYAGYDPSNAANWQLVGRFNIAPPIGRKCTIKLGGDALVITEMGIISLSAIFDGKAFNPDEDAITSKLGNAIDAYLVNKGTHGWQAVLHPSSQMLVFNVPAGGGLSYYYQYVMNTQTSAWCRFTNLNGISWAVLGGKLYFGGSDGTVYLADYGYADNGNPIRCDVQQSYNRFGKMNLKHWHSAKLIVSFSGSPPVNVGFSTDFRDDQPDYVSSPAVSNDALWNVATWNVDFWSIEGGVQYIWTEIQKEGFSGSLWFRANVIGDQIKWYATEYLFEEGGLIGSAA